MNVNSSPVPVVPELSNLSGVVPSSIKTSFPLFLLILFKPLAISLTKVKVVEAANGAFTTVIAAPPPLGIFIIELAAELFLEMEISKAPAETLALSKESQKVVLISAVETLN
jgi:hypothetical protein